MLQDRFSPVAERWQPYNVLTSKFNFFDNTTYEKVPFKNKLLQPVQKLQLNLKKHSLCHARLQGLHDTGGISSLEGNGYLLNQPRTKAVISAPPTLYINSGFRKPQGPDVPTATAMTLYTGCKAEHFAWFSFAVLSASESSHYTK